MHYATGEDTAAFIMLLARLLQPQPDNASHAVQMSDMVSRLAHNTNVCQPPSPYPSPPSKLEAWDSSSHLRHIQHLLCVANHITLLVQYHVGGFLKQNLDQTTSTRKRSKIVTHLCEACTCSLCWLQGGRHGSPITPCRTYGGTSHQVCKGCAGECHTHLFLGVCIPA